MTEPAPPPGRAGALSPKAAARLQKAYAAKRRAWAAAVGRPYLRKDDPRPPPGEINAEAEE